MAKDLLFEIGAEEIPAGFMPNILGQLKQLAETKLNDAHLPFESIATYGTPRRLALIVKGLADTSAEISERHKGPSASIAYDADGNATKAAIGFARGKGLDVADLVVEDGYIYAETKTAGVPAKDIVTDMLPQLITGLNFPKSMHWGNLDAKFVRPVRWLVALLDEEVIPVEFATVKSGNVTRGHRFLGADEITIKNAASYVDTLKENFVMVDQDARRELISKQLHDIAASKNASIVWDDDLLEEINYLVEWPTALCGGFEESYLALPDAAIITPDANPNNNFSTFRLNLFFIKNTIADPKVVPKNGIANPIVKSILSLLSYNLTKYNCYANVNFFSYLYCNYIILLKKVNINFSKWIYIENEQFITFK